ncbi:hypothetical protein CTEN210_14938 [Chaetoceros tenuissimus]|uniref:Uncharacterized protein n=1 Tax=Chaetoceros tenuissimus TaxID=426638 RepID=A0AAD3D6P2_9STRA|nr:hypothetical protein CTEN210_14938 [Chaetoceros tenuissimus]
MEMQQNQEGSGGHVQQQQYDETLVHAEHNQQQQQQQQQQQGLQTYDNTLAEAATNDASQHMYERENEQQHAHNSNIAPEQMNNQQQETQQQQEEQDSDDEVEVIGVTKGNKPPPQEQQQQQNQVSILTPYNFAIDQDLKCTWQNMLPTRNKVPAPMPVHTDQVRAYRLSLLSNSYFTITAIMHHTNSYDFIPSLMGIRKPIKEIVKNHGEKGESAILEDGKWRIPLSVYQVFYNYLSHQQKTYVEPIPNHQIQIASLGKAAAERGYPSPEELISHGIPSGLANGLAPYQRGGVDFVLQRNGKALIADEMGLGKTVQGIAAMACYEDEWPVLVLSPSTARYHWEAEFLNWLGKDSEINRKVEQLEEEKLFVGDLDSEAEEKKLEFNGEYSNKRRLDFDQQDSKRSKPMPTIPLLDPSEINVMISSSDPMLKPNTRVVVLSYGLVANLAKKELLTPGSFKCVIVDESHMLKNKKSKRTMSVMPLLKSAKRVVMLSGTPAFSRPQELFPQLNALGEHKGWWADEEEFNSKYTVDKYSDPSFAELHTLLTSTVMIRRLKNDILKDMPSKLRENVHIELRDPLLSNQIKEGLLALRTGKGLLGKLSLLHQKLEPMQVVPQNNFMNPNLPQPQDPSSNVFFGQQPQQDEEPSRKAILNQIFRQTGTAKIPVIVDMLKLWLNDPTNTKICIFAHHINVLDALVEQGGLSNHEGSKSKFIKIDGSTNPKFRQEQITSFQNDPTVRVAVLGITAAGVGVTLTAASTIWFAELFWTPALMIQAEDRCHRIGQQARVRCLYTIAKGTLDEVLWILLKRKFRALGEFVEGQEMMDIVVHTTYQNEVDAVLRKSENDLDSDTEDVEEKKDANALANEDTIQHDIEELATEDMKLAAGNEDDDPDDEPQNFERKKPKAKEEDIICLSDDEDETEVQVETTATTAKAAKPKPVDPTENTTSETLFHRYNDSKWTIPPPSSVHSSFQLSKPQHFYMFFKGPSYRLSFFPVAGRIMVSENKATLPDSNGIQYPAFGDILVAINDTLVDKFHYTKVVHMLKSVIHSNSYVRLFFVRDVYLSNAFQKWRELDLLPQLHSRPKVKDRSPEPTSALPEDQTAGNTNNSSVEVKSGESGEEDDVIEILD